MKTSRWIRTLVIGLLGYVGARAEDQPEMVHEVLYDFQASPAYPSSLLLKHGTDETFYGLSTSGGRDGNGTIYSVKPDGTIRVLHSFANGAIGGGGMCVGANDQLFGWTTTDGQFGNGTFFRLNPGGGMVVLHHFTNEEGSDLQGPLVFHDGHFYGNLRSGGSSYYGAVVRLSLEGACTVLLPFRGQVDDGEGGGPRHDEPEKRGAYPVGGLTLAADGKLYGITTSGGMTTSSGTVFRLSPDGSAVETLLDFTGYGGAAPSYGIEAGLTLGSDGWLYGVSNYGGLTYETSTRGTVFRVSTSGTYELISELSNPALVGYSPRGALTQAQDGNFYFTTYYSRNTGFGAILRLTPAGVLSVVRELTGGTGPSNPRGTLVQGADGLLYGVSEYGGAQSRGAVFRMDGSNGNLAVVTDFTALGYPRGPLVEDDDGAFWGVAESFNHGGVYRLGPDGSFKVVVAFNGANGSRPFGGLVKGADGNWYGNTLQGGLFGYGTLFKLTPAGALTVLHAGNADTGGTAYYRSALCLGPDGALYGTSGYGGTGYGEVYRLAQDGTVSTFAAFSGTNGAHPQAALVLGSDNHFYGITNGGGANGRGTIFKVSQAGEITLIRHLDYAAGEMLSRLALTEQNEYFAVGRSGSAWPYYYGTVFWGFDNSYGLLHYFSYSGQNLWRPAGALTRGLDGHLYGLASYGGATESGGIYRLDLPSGSYSQILSFTGTEGANRGRYADENELIVGKDGHFYGTTYGGGHSDFGTVFRLRATDPKLLVKNESDTELAELTELDFGPAVLGESTERRIRLRNAGGLPMTGITFDFSGTGASGFQVVAAPPEPLLPRSEVEVVLRFTPDDVGDWRSTVSIGSNDPANPAYELILWGDGAGDPAKIYRQPASLLLRTGQAAAFQVVAAGKPAPTVTWQKNGRPLKGAVGSRLSLPAVTTADAGTYTAIAANGSSNTSQPAQLGVLVRAPNQLQVARGQSITLACNAFIPAGIETRFQWLRNDVELAGQTSNTLAISAARPDTDQATYTCRVRMLAADGTLERTHGNTYLLVVDTPQVTQTSFPTVMVSQPVDLWLNADGFPLEWKATGLPPGLSLDRQFGRITGRPTAARIVNGTLTPYFVTLSVRNAAGWSRSVVVPWYVTHLPFTVIGKYSGLISLHDNPASDLLGGPLDFTIASTGAVSGTVELKGKKWPFKGVLEVTGGYHLSITVTTATHSLPLDIRFWDADENSYFTGSLGAGALYHTVKGYRSPWVSGNTAAAYIGTYHVALRPYGAGDLPVSALPHGDGFLRVQVSATGGTRWSGRLPDSSPVSGSTVLGTRGSVRVRQLLYAGTGIVQGFVHLYPANGSVGNYLDWFKKPQPASSKTRSYRAGFDERGGDSNGLNCWGGRYVPPPTATQPMLLPGMIDAPDNAKIEFTDGGLPPAGMTRLFRVRPDMKVELPAQSPNDLITFQVNPATGLFSGKMIREDADPTGPTTKPRIHRQVDYFGLIIPGFPAVGFFNLPQLPSDDPPTTMDTSPIYSGRVRFTQTNSG